MLKERERLSNMLGIVASLRHAGLEVGKPVRKKPVLPPLSDSPYSPLLSSPGSLLKQRNVQPIVTVRGALRSFLCYPVGDDKLLLFYVNAPLGDSLRVSNASTSAPLTVSTDSSTTRDELETSSSPSLDGSGMRSNSNSSSNDIGDEVEVDDMSRICTELQQLLMGVKFESTK